MKWRQVIQDKISALKNYRTKSPWSCCICDVADISALQNHEGSNTAGIRATGVRATGTSLVWKAVRFPTVLRDKGHYWYRCAFVVPQSVQNIPVAGSRAALRCFVINATEVYLQGRKVFHEKFWTDFRMPEVILTECASPGEQLEIMLHLDKSASAGIGPDFSVWLEIDKVEEVVFQLETFLHEMQYCSHFPQIEELYQKAEQTAEEDITQNRSIDDTIGIIRKIRTLLEPAARHTKEHVVHLVGHAHIDMNWLWTMDDTVSICRRDFETMTRLIEENPDFHFSQSQAAVYDITEKNFPELFQKIQTV